MALCKVLFLLALFVAVFADEDAVELRRRMAALEAKLKRIQTHQAHLSSLITISVSKAAGGYGGQRGSPGPRGPPGSSAGGVQYVRWGKTTCPAGASLVYKGRIGGESHGHKGGGVNYLCLTEQPKYLQFKNGYQNSGRLFGAEYQVSQYGGGRTLFGRHLHDDDAVCAVCHVRTRSAKLMIPGTYVCPAGWKREYYGYLMTEFYNHPHPRDFICVDQRAEGVPGSRKDQNGALMYPVEGQCGSLPCGPYVAAREITCAVCTK